MKHVETTSGCMSCLAAAALSSTNGDDGPLVTFDVYAPPAY